MSGEGDAAGGGAAPRGRPNDDVAAPPSALTYPPLAYLLNALLAGLNFLRECPLLAAKDALHTELAAAARDCCAFLVSIAGDLRARGAKYLPAGGDKKAAAAGKTDDKGVPLPMDKQYAVVFAQDILPHIFACFEHVYADAAAPAADGAGAKAGARRAAAAVCLRAETLAAAKEGLGPESYAAVAAVWGLLRKAELLPSAAPLAQPVAFKPAPAPTPAPTPAPAPAPAAAPSAAPAAAPAAVAAAPSPVSAKPPPGPPADEDEWQDDF